MNKHIFDERLSAYADGYLSDDQNTEVKLHLDQCNSCTENLNALKDLKLRLAKLPRLTAPAILLHQLNETFTTVSWWKKWSRSLQRPIVWQPIGAFALVLLTVGIWLYVRTPTTQETIDLDPLLTAHSRYGAESVIQQADLQRTDYSARLASYYNDEE